MSKLLNLFLSFFVCSTVYANTGLIVATGIAKESVTSPRKVDIDLYQLGVFYKATDNFLIGGSVQRGHPNISTMPFETRYEISAGTVYKIGNIAPYLNVSLGQRNFRSSAVNDYSYHAINVGSKFMISNFLYTDIKYRYRDNHEDSVNWKTNLYGVGIGYNVFKQTAIEIGYAKVDGDYKSTQWGLFLINRY